MDFLQGSFNLSFNSKSSKYLRSWVHNYGQIFKQMLISVLHLYLSLGNIGQHLYLFKGAHVILDIVHNFKHHIYRTLIHLLIFRLLDLVCFIFSSIPNRQNKINIFIWWPSLRSVALTWKARPCLVHSRCGSFKLFMKSQSMWVPLTRL